MRRKRYGSGLLKKEICEVCGYDEQSTLHIHHIIPRSDPRCSNNLTNLAVLCSRCHNLCHAGLLTIVGVFQSTAGRKLGWFYKDEPCNIPKEHWKIKPEDNPLVITIKKKPTY